MNPERGDEALVLEMLNNCFQLAKDQAMLEILEAIANHVGITNLNGMAVRESFERRKRELAEELVADLADTMPALASQIKRAWEEFDRRGADEC